MLLSFVQTLLLSYIGTHGLSAASIFEEPETQYIFTGSTANFSCQTFSEEVFWFIDGKLVNYWESYSEDRPEFIFSGNENGNLRDLHLSVLGNNATNGTTIYCQTLVNGVHELSRTATLYVFDSFFPPPKPVISVEAMNEELQLMIVEPYRWADFEQSAYNISSSGGNLSLFLSTTGNLSFVISLKELTASPLYLQPCSRYLLQVTAVSPVFGASQPSKVEFITPYEEMLELNSMIAKVYFNSIGAPFLNLQVQINRICSLLNYTFNIYINGVNNDSLRIGPREMTDSGMINEMLIPGLERNKQYTAHVEVNYTVLSILQRSVVSDTLTFETSFDQNLLRDETEGQLNPKTDNYLVLALEIICAILCLTIATFIIVCICLWKRVFSHKRIGRESTSSDVMVPNPIYSGPLYETVPQGYNPLCSSASTTPDSSPTTPNNSSIHYTLNPTSRPDIVDLVRQNSLPTHPNERIPSPLTRTSYRSSSISSNSTIRKPQHERNKLHLTLSLGMSEKERDKNTSVKQRVSVLSDDANYTVMSPVVIGRFESSLSGGWAETNPEMASK